MDLSIIIPVCSDLRIEKCINSIDEDVEVIASLNRPTEDIKKLVKKLGIKYCEIDKNNLGIAYNRGLDLAGNDIVLFMDSDCVFGNGTIKKLFEPFNQDKHYLSRGYVKYRTDSLESRIVKMARKVSTSNVPYAFMPPLMLRKQIFEKINDGYRFAEDTVWAVDYEFELRRKKAKIPLKIFKDAYIYHEPLNFRSDLKSAFLYGTGKRIRHCRTDEKVNLFEVLKNPILRGLKEEGFVAAAYLAIWKTVLYTGYYSQKYFQVQEKMNNR